MKEFKNYEEQLQLLKNRGLVILNEELAYKRLIEENYYNIINGYKTPFLKDGKETDEFIDGTSFEDIYELYLFDRELRNIFLKRILHQENLLRSKISYIFSREHGHDNYLKLQNFDTLENNFTSTKETHEKRIKDIQRLIADLQMDIVHSIDKKMYIKHYINKYGFVPFWVVVNCITLGRLSNFYQLMKQSERIEVSKHWGIQEKDLKQYIRVLAHYRNICAHDDRFYNSKIDNFGINDTIYHEKIIIEKVNDRYRKGKNDVFSLLIVFKILLPHEEFLTLCNKIDGRMRSLETKIKSIDVTQIFDDMGFVKGWHRIKEMSIENDEITEQITIEQFIDSIIENNK